MPTDDLLIIAASEQDANLYYLTRFLAPDPFVFVRIKGEKILLMSDLELDRAQAQATVDTVLALSDAEAEAARRGAAQPTLMDALDVVLRPRGATAFLVPASFPVGSADDLRARGYTLTPRREPFVEARLIKSEDEVRAIAETQAATEASFAAAVEVLRKAEVRTGMLYAGGQPLTAERVRQVIHETLMAHDCLGRHTIVACGEQGCDPHQEGSGPLRSDTSIVMDIFPHSARSRYYADMTRTVVKGRAPEPLRRLYDVVREAQEAGLATVRAGVNGREVNGQVCKVFTAQGYETGRVNGRMQGFFHGTGHGVGLEIHEPPRLSRVDAVLQAGQVVTVEPGLYYPGVGAVRLEDMVVVTEQGCRNLTQAPKVLEV